MGKILRYGSSLFLWALTYYVVAIASLAFDDPQSKKAVIWFPAGVAVAAFLSSRRSHWPLLLLALLIAKVMLATYGDFAGHTIFSAAFGVLGALVIAGLVRYLTRSGDELHEVVVWIIATVTVTAVWVILRKMGAELMGGDFPQNTFWAIWISLINGIFYATVIFMGLVHPYSVLRPIKARAALFGGFWLLLLGLVTWYVFSGPPHWLVSIVQSNTGAAIYFMLTCLPLVLTIIVTVVGGRRISSLALLVLGVMVVSYTDQRIGPVYLVGLLRGEPLVLAQSYLSIIALLVAVIRATTGAPCQHNPQSGPLPGQSVAYQLHMTSGQICWDDHAPLLLGVSTKSLSSQQAVMQRVHPDDIDKLKDHWLMDIGQPTYLALRVRQDNGEWLSIGDLSPGIVLGTEGRLRVGVWRIG